MRWLAYLYGLGVRGRLLMFRTGLRKPRRLPHPVISVGNLTVGGTGKTPMTEFLARWLLQQGRRPIILSRGYGGSAERSHLFVTVGTRTLCSPLECGDEAWLLASRLENVPIVVGKDRYGSGRLLDRTFPGQIFLLDDGFQHLQLERDLNLLLLDAEDPFGGNQLVPAGRLREPLTGMRRADAVLITRASDSDSFLRLRREVQLLAPRCPVFPVSFQVAEPHRFSAPEAKLPERSRREGVVAFAGIARPEQFFRDLEGLGVALKDRLPFRDHHFFLQDEVDEIFRRCDELGAQFAVTTEKDAVRLLDLNYPKDRLYVLPLMARADADSELVGWLEQRLDRIMGTASEPASAPHQV